MYFHNQMNTNNTQALPYIIFNGAASTCISLGIKDPSCIQRRW